MNTDYLLTLDRDDIAGLSTEELREAAVSADLYSRRNTIASLPIGTAEVASKAGTLTVLDKTVAALLVAYSHRRRHRDNLVRIGRDHGLGGRLHASGEPALPG